MDAGSAGGGSLLIAGDGDDKLISGRHSGADILEGGPGADVFSLESDHKNDSIVCGPGDDQIIGAVFGQDLARDGCPPVDAIRTLRRADGRGDPMPFEVSRRFAVATR
jgi:RTX calcium-binding nonapeptide repeat (4 copies)